MPFFSVFSGIFIMTPSYRVTILVLAVLLSELITSTYTQSTYRTATSGAPPPLTEEQKKKAVAALESSLLTLFGFSRRPRPSKGVVIPQYMIDLYRQQSGDTDTPIPAVYTRKHSSSPANTVRSFFHEGESHFILFSIYVLRIFRSYSKSKVSESILKD